jgi:hypothetical protein
MKLTSSVQGSNRLQMTKYRLFVDISTSHPLDQTDKFKYKLLEVEQSSTVLSPMALALRVLGELMRSA